MAPAIHRLVLATGQIKTTNVDESVGWVVPIAGQQDYMAGFKSGFWRIDLETGARTLIANPESDRPQNRMNDGKVDSFGRIWAGTKDDSDEQASGALYRLDGDLSCSRVDDGYQVTNGPTFSLDGQTLYHTDSAAREVYAFDLGNDGAITNKRVWLRFDEDWGYPDGMTTDAEGCIWIAHWAGAMISRFSPDGQRVAVIPLPASNITSCAFAGPGLDRLFVTSSTIDCEDEELAGSLFEVEVGVCGISPGAFALLNN